MSLRGGWKLRRRDVIVFLGELWGFPRGGSFFEFIIFVNAMLSN